MKNLKTFLAAAVLGLLAVSVQAQSGRANKKFEIPVDVNSKPTPSVEFVGLAVSSSNAAGTIYGNQNQTRSTAQVFFTGEGVLYDIVLSSGAATDWAACWDKAAATTVTDPFAALDVTLVGAVQAITTAWRRLSDGGRHYPIRIRSGLVCKSSLAAPTGMYYPVFEKK